MRQRLVLPKSIYEEIIAHAREGYPEEVCGLISGKDGRATALYRARNIAENREINYTVDPQTLLKQVEFEERGEVLAAIYHSHPVSPPYPSATDARQAFYPDTVYIICSLQDWDNPEMRGWRLVQHTAEQADTRPPETLKVAGRTGLWAEHKTLGEGRAHYTIWWEEEGHIWVQEVDVEEVHLEVVDEGTA